MTKIIQLNEIKSIIAKSDLLPLIEDGFIAYSRGAVVQPPVGEMVFDHPPGDVHIKYGYLRNGENYVVKISSGFYRNDELGLPSSNGLMLLFNKQNGLLKAILLDEGYLTDVRTAVAGAICAKYLAPTRIERIGMIGAGTQALLQLQFLKQVMNCREVVIYGRDRQKLQKFQTVLNQMDYHVVLAEDINKIPATCNFIVTTTPSQKPLLYADQIRPGTHITAVGADTEFKQELHVDIFKQADLVVVDSLVQCKERGDTSHALRSSTIGENQLVELGSIIAGDVKGRINNQQITVADLTGLAVQDLQIANAIYASSH